MIFSGNGAGSQADPYQVVTKAHLDELRNLDYDGSSDRYFILMNDIEFNAADFDVSGDFYNNGDGWIPLSTDNTSAWYGDFNLNGFSITGLFGRISRYGGFVGVLGFYLNAKGRIYNGAIEGVFEGEREIGVIAGRITEGECENIHAKGTVNIYDFAVNSHSSIGGFAGLIRDDASVLLNCSADVTVNGGDATGVAGFATITGGSVTPNIINKCYSKGAVSAPTGSDIFGGLRLTNSLNTITNSFYDSETSGVATQVSEGMSAKTTAEMQTLDTFTNIANADLDEAWDIVSQSNFDEQNPNTWVLPSGGYPTLYHAYEPVLNPSGVISLNGSPLEGAVVTYFQTPITNDNNVDVSGTWVKQVTGKTKLGESITNAQGEHGYTGESFDDTQLLEISVDYSEYDTQTNSWKHYGKSEWSDLNLDLSAPS